MEQRNNAHDERIEKIRDYVFKNMENNPYHNPAHAEDVAGICTLWANLEGVSRADVFVLRTAAYMHDITCEVGAKDNEERSAKLTLYLLPKFDYTVEEAELSANLILATKLPTNPQSLLEQIICDADVDNLGREVFFEKNELLRKELGIEDELAWLKRTLEFLQNHRYYTRTAQALRNEGLARNIELLRQKIAE